MPETKYKYKVLIVDDQIENIQIANNLLEDHYEVQAATSGKVALNIVHSDTPPDIILLDVLMPDMNGYEVCKQIKNNPETQHIPIIFLTGITESTSEKYGFDLGASDYITKPIQPEVMLARIHTHLLLSAQNRQLTFQVVEQSKKIAESYTHDELTGLENMYSFNCNYDKNSNVFLALININQFHQINEYYGFNAGDSILLQMKKRLLEFFSEIGNIYRNNNDEFAVSANINKISLEDFLDLLNDFSESMLTNLFYTNTDETALPQVRIPLQVTIGVANTKDNLHKNASMALHQAKHQMKALLLLQDDVELKKNHERNFNIIRMVQDAIVENKIITHYQPIIDNKTHAIRKYETLVRLIDIKQTVHPPFSFLDIAKKGRLYPHITCEVFKQAFVKFENRKESFTLNIELEDILNQKTNAFILEMIQTFKDPKRIVIEIVESQYLEENAMVDTFLASLKAKGCKISLDDFGTGYSNFEYLLRLNTDILKIDGSLIKNIDTSKESRLIVESIVQFAHKMGIETVAEFVERESIYKIVESMGITYSQGYFFGKPEADLLPESFN